MIRSGIFFNFVFLLITVSIPLYGQGAVSDTLDVEVVAVENDSALIAGAGLKQGVSPYTEGIVYLPFLYRGAEYKNRIARCAASMVQDSTCQMRILYSTARVRPNYRIMLFNLAGQQEEEIAAQPQPPQKVPFYRKKWFWIAGGAAATAAILVITGGDSDSKSNSGTINVSGSLP